MKRKVYLICQKKWWKGNRTPQLLSDGKGKLLYVFGSIEGKKRAEKIVDRLNKDYTKQEVHLREGYLIIGRASQTSASKTRKTKQ